jgi:NAD(P) transhydrogenase subunit alpha
VWGADVVVKVAPPSAEESARLSSDGVLIGFLAPLTAPDTVRALAQSGATAFALEAVPRISRAQSMDALSSQSNVAGYRAALLGAQLLGRFYPMLMTAAGTVRPAKVLVLGAGVAGLQAIATARRLGAAVTGYDVRSAVAEQVKSLGADFLELEAGKGAEGEGGYARELTDEEKAAQQQELTDAITEFDVVITTALVPGRPAPKLVTADAVERMKPGAVVVDLAGEAGGNCELSEPGETVVKHDVTIAAPAQRAQHDGRARLPALRPQHPVAARADDGEDGALNLDFDDEIIAGPASPGAARSSTRAPSRPRGPR